jgi:CBS domain-containing protein
VPPAADAVDLELVARSAANVMVTAREAAERVAWARWIRERGAHRRGPFIAVRVAMNRQVRAADVDKWFARAAGGTLFIDCVEHLSADGQARLNALLSDQSRRSNGVAAVNGEDRVRVITGSHRSLRAALAVGAFDDTLFYRLNVIHIDHMRPDEAGEHGMKARDVMSQPPYTCGPNTDLATVAKIMWDHDCGFVPVVDASGSVTGAVTDRDICIATSTRRLLPEHI